MRWRTQGCVFGMNGFREWKRMWHITNASQRNLRVELFQSFQAPVHRPVLAPLVECAMMSVLPSIRVVIASPSDGVHLEFKIPAHMSSSQDLVVAVATAEYPHLWKQHLGPHGTFSAFHLFSWIQWSEQLKENKRYVQLLVHLGNGGAVPVHVHHQPFQRRRGGFKGCQLCQSDNSNQCTSLGFVWLHVWSSVISNFGILSL